MPDPSEWFAVARLLLSAGDAGPPPEAQLRRAASSAYYALFHKICHTAAERFMGAGTREKAGYNLIYRGFNHGRVKAVCELLSAVVLNRNLQRQLGRLAVSSAVRDFADIFAYAQDERHRADYDPSAEFTIVEATDVVDAAQIALDAFDRIEADELADVLALMLTNVRG